MAAAWEMSAHVQYMYKWQQLSFVSVSFRKGDESGEKMKCESRNRSMRLMGYQIPKYYTLV